MYRGEQQQQQYKMRATVPFTFNYRNCTSGHSFLYSILLNFYYIMHDFVYNLRDMYIFIEAKKKSGKVPQYKTTINVNKYNCWSHCIRIRCTGFPFFF